MTDLIYCGTVPVGAAETQSLLAGVFGAIWSPPMHRRVSPAKGDRLWVLWLNPPSSPLLLGAGRVLFTPEDRFDWTNRTAPGIVHAARALGYGGPTNMAFLRLGEAQAQRDMPPIEGLGEIMTGLTLATPGQTALLSQFLPM